MGRILFVIGIIMTVAGCAIPFVTMGGMFANMAPMMDLATDRDAREAELCNVAEGETLEEVQGASTYTQGHGYGRSTTLYCVDEEGNRRDVTMDLVEGMLGDDLFGSISNTIGQTFLATGLSIVGVILMVVGAIMSLGKRKNVMMVNPYNAAINMNPMQPMQPSQNNPQGLTAQLQQLEQAYKQNLISREEYDKARQNLLNK